MFEIGFKNRLVTCPFQWSGLKKPLPGNVNLLTLEQHVGNDVLLRLEHTYAIGEDPVLSKPVTVSLRVSCVGSSLFCLKLE